MDYLNENYEKKLNTIFSENLKRCMQYYQIRNVDLSNRLNVSVQTVSAWTNGNKMPRMKMLDKICEVLHCNRSELLDEGGFATMEGRKTIEYYEENNKAYDEYLKSLPFDHPEILSIRWNAAKSDIIGTVDDLNLNNIESLADFARYLLWKQEKGKGE